MEDALKKLDKLTHEEARMAIAENLKVTYTVDDRMKGVVDKVLDVSDAVKGVDARVTNIDDGVHLIIDGAQTVFISSPKIHESRCPKLWTTSNVRMPIATWMLNVQTQSLFQGANCDKTFVHGSLHQIPLRTTILHAVLIIREQPIGFLKAAYLGSGNQLAPCCGFTESVRSLYYFHLLLLNFMTLSGIWQKCPLVRHARTMSTVQVLTSRSAPPLSRISFPYATVDWL